MKHSVSDISYDEIEFAKSTKLVLAEERLYEKISNLMPYDEFIKIEDELRCVRSMVEKEVFDYGFIEGVRFLLKCM